MTRSEFEAWKRHTAATAHTWTIDPIHDGKNCPDILIHKGGEAGTFIRIDEDGLVSVGDYEGAIPHIGEALFRPKGAHQCASRDDGLARICEAMGPGFLRQILISA